jgi:neutral ceramidase
MKQLGITAGKITTGFILIFILNSCSVVKTPFFKTDYYQKTVSRLDSLKPGISKENDSLYAGFSKVSITPGLNHIAEKPEDGLFNKVPMAGFGQRRGKSATGVHDSIFVKAVALCVGKELLVLVSADMLIMPPNIIDSVTSLLAKEGIKRNQIFYSATHSHSGIGGWAYGFIGKQFAGKENKKIEKWLTMQIKKAVLTAISDLHPARLGSGSFNAGLFTRNRLTGNPEQKNDDFNFIVLEQLERRKAVIGSFSAHSTTLGAYNMEISADYPGYWERKMEDSTTCLAMFCGGSMGSQSPVGKGSGYESAKSIGESLADSLLLHMKQVKMNDSLNLSSLSLKLNLPEYHFRLTTNMNLSSCLSNRLMPLPKNVYLQTIRINNLIWVFTPGDFSGESARQIKNLLAAKGYDAIVSGYNGSYVGYIIPGKYFYLDHYETRLMGWFGPTMGDYTMDLIDQMINTLILRQ